MTYPPLRVMRFGGNTLAEGLDTHLIEGVTIQVTNILKTIPDCFKFRNKIWPDVALEALKDAWQKKQVTMDEIWRYAQLCRVQNVMRPYLEELADD